MDSEPRRDVAQESIGDLVRDLTTDLSRLMRQEVALARAEIREDAARAGRAAGMLAGASLAGWLTLLFVSLAAMFALATAVDIGWAALIVAAVWASLAALLYASGRAALKDVTGPQQTIQTLKEIKEDVR